MKYSLFAPSSKEVEKTDFAPAERESKREVVEENKFLQKIDSLNLVLEALPYIVMVLNEERQIVHSNSTILTMLGLHNIGEILALRPGELIHCVHAHEGPGGCGTSKSCSVCGAVQAILESQKTGERISREARITSKIEGQAISWDLLVVATPVSIQGKQFTIVSMADISEKKRKSYLERIFFHDILNTSGVISGYAELLKDEVNSHAKEMADVICTTTTHLVEEIRAQRELTVAESGELKVKPDFVNPGDIMKEVANFYGCLAAEKGCYLKVNCEYEGSEFKSDHLLLKRVIGNLTKNALEASGEGDLIQLSCWEKDNSMNFSVQNPLAMPEEVRLQIFNRSFSTKGENRGLGTYSIKLLTERYLEGTVSFVSDEEFGTIFSLNFPMMIE